MSPQTLRGPTTNVCEARFLFVSSLSLSLFLISRLISLLPMHSFAIQTETGANKEARKERKKGAPFASRSCEIKGGLSKAPTMSGRWCNLLCMASYCEYYSKQQCCSGWIKEKPLFLTAVQIPGMGEKRGMMLSSLHQIRRDGNSRISANNAFLKIAHSCALMTMIRNIAAYQILMCIIRTEFLTRIMIDSSSCPGSQICNRSANHNKSLCI